MVKINLDLSRNPYNDTGQKRHHYCFRDEFISMTTRLSLLGAEVIAFTDIPEVARMATKAFNMPSYRGMTLPFVYALATELYSVYVGEANNFNVDSPRNRKKITITK